MGDSLMKKNYWIKYIGISIGKFHTISESNMLEQNIGGKYWS